MRVKDNETGLEEKVLKEYQESKLVTQTKLNKNGINCTQWFSKEKFKIFFTILEN